MANNKVAIRRRSIRSNEYSLGGSGGYLTTLKAHVSELRDQFRSGFPDTSRYVVSDISQWNGVSGCVGLAFIFRDKTKGCEWLFSFGTRTDTSAQLYSNQYVGNQSGATIGAYYQILSTTSTSNPSFANSSLGLLHFNYDYSVNTYAMGFSNTTTLTYGSGDYQAPASSPYSALAAFMPPTASRNVCYDFGSAIGGAGKYQKFHYVYYPEKGALCVDVSFGSNSGYYVSYIYGKELYPTNAAGGVANAMDSRRDGTIAIQRNPSGSTWSSPESSAYMFCGFIRDNGTTIENLGRPVNILSDFNRSNYLVAGLVQKRKLQVSVSGYIKGYLDPEIVCEAFPFDDSGFKHMRLSLPDSDNPMIKDHPQICRFWVKDYVPFEVLPDSGLPID